METKMKKNKEFYNIFLSILERKYGKENVIVEPYDGTNLIHLISPKFKNAKSKHYIEADIKNLVLEADDKRHPFVVERYKECPTMGLAVLAFRGWIASRRIPTVKAILPHITRDDYLKWKENSGKEQSIINEEVVYLQNVGAEGNLIIEYNNDLLGAVYSQYIFGMPLGTKVDLNVIKAHRKFLDTSTQLRQAINNGFLEVLTKEQYKDNRYISPKLEIRVEKQRKKEQEWLSNFRKGKNQLENYQK